MSRRALAQVALLNQQLAALRRQIGALEEALEASETRDRESQARIADLGRRLNVALAQRVQELSRYRSDFFGRLREILSRAPTSASSATASCSSPRCCSVRAPTRSTPRGREELAKLASAIIELQGEIPDEIEWVLRIDGHTDNRPISSARFPSNWELSAARAISVVRALIDEGVDPRVPRRRRLRRDPPARGRRHRGSLPDATAASSSS